MLPIGDDNSDRFDTYRWAFAQTDFGKFAANVWKTDKSRYVTTPKTDLEYGEFVDTSRNGTGHGGACFPAAIAAPTKRIIATEAAASGYVNFCALRRLTWFS